MATAKVSNISIALRAQYAGGDNHASVRWTTEEARFHFWTDLPATAPEAFPNIYKNPPEGTPYNGPGYYNTRRLRPDSKPVAAMLAQVAAAIEAGDLVAKAYADRDAVIAEDAARNARETAAHQEKERLGTAGRALLDAIKPMARFFAENGGDAEYHDHDGTGWVSRALAAIEAAEARS